MSVSRCVLGDARARRWAYWWTPGHFRMADPKPEGTLSAQELCEITGLTDRHHRRISAAGHFPPPILGRYQVGKTLLGIIRYQRELIQRKSNKLAKEQVALTKARRETAQEELAAPRSAGGHHRRGGVMVDLARLATCQPPQTSSPTVSVRLGPLPSGAKFTTSPAR